MKETEKLFIRKKKLVVSKDENFINHLEEIGMIKLGEYNTVPEATLPNTYGEEVIKFGTNMDLEVASCCKRVNSILSDDYSNKPIVTVTRDLHSTDGCDYYLDILESYTQDEYDLAYKYYIHTEARSESFRDYEEIENARFFYHDIVSAIEGIADIIYIDNNNELFEFNMYRTHGLKFLAEKKELDQYIEDEDGERYYHSKKALLTDFNRSAVLKFVDDLMELNL